MLQIPIHQLLHIGVVVRSARATAERYARIHGVTHWDVIDWEPSRLGKQSTHGFRAEHSYRVATGSAGLKCGSICFQLIEPRGGWTTFQEFLLTRGEGIHSICTSILTQKELVQLRDWLASENIPIGQSATLDGIVDSVYLDTRRCLGGFYLQVLVPYSEDWASRIAPDEVWELSSLVPPDGPLYNMTSFQHFGVVVTDLMERVQSWSRLFGIKEWNFRDWHSGPGSLEKPTYLGSLVDHAYLTTMATIADGLAFEIIQPTFGPSHYKDFLQQSGEGIHHLHATQLDSMLEWEALRHRMAGINVPIVVSGGILNEFLDFYYLDMRSALAGYTMEVVTPGRNFAQGRPVIPWAMTANFSEPVS